MKKGEKLQQQCDVCGKWLDKSIDNFKKYSRKTNGLNFHTTCRECEDRIKVNTEWKEGKLLCHICGEYKDISEFTSAGTRHKVRNNKDYRCNNCKSNQRKKIIENYDDDTKLIKVLQARWHGAKDRAIRKQLPFDISKQDLLVLWKLQDGKCALSGLPMTYELAEGRVYTNVSIDQIEPSKGYTKENIQLVCMAVNQLKSDFDLNTVLTICKSILENFKQNHGRSR